MVLKLAENSSDKLDLVESLATCDHIPVNMASERVNKEMLDVSEQASQVLLAPLECMYKTSKLHMEKDCGLIWKSPYGSFQIPSPIKYMIIFICVGQRQIIYMLFLPLFWTIVHL